MKFFLCEKHQSITTISWCLRNAQKQKTDRPACQRCDPEITRQARTLYNVEQLFCEAMMDEYKQILHHGSERLAA